MKHNLKFFPEKRKDKTGRLISESVPIFADIRFAGSRLFYFTGYRVDLDWEDQNIESKPGKLRGSWDFLQEKVKKNASVHEGRRAVPYNIANDRLALIRAELVRLFEGVPDRGTIIHQLDEVCKKSVKTKPGEMEFYPMFERYAREARFSDGKKKHVISTINHWRNFNKSLTFGAINSDTMKAFEKFMLTDKKRARGINTVSSILKITRSFWNYCRKEFEEKKKTLHYPFENYTIPPEVYTTPVYITTEERNHLFNFELSSERLARVRDIFVFQCYVGARVGDLVRFTTENVNNGILSYIPRKTKEGKPVVVEVPLSEKAREILSHYRLPDGRLMPFITDQRYNDYLKELFELAGLTRPVTRLNPTTREEEQVRLCDIASSHMARRAFVGNLYGKVDSGIISSMSGHIQGSKAFTRYYNVSTELQRGAIEKLS